MNNLSNYVVEETFLGDKAKDNPCSLVRNEYFISVKKDGIEAATATFEHEIDSGFDTENPKQYTYIHTISLSEEVDNKEEIINLIFDKIFTTTDGYCVFLPRQLGYNIIAYAYKYCYKNGYDYTDFSGCEKSIRMSKPIDVNKNAN